jgi:hypothetical protein
MKGNTTDECWAQSKQLSRRTGAKRMKEADVKVRHDCAQFLARHGQLLLPEYVRIA